ncbi:leucine-rich repeat-containing protein 71 isoform X2 [Chroicocephalus ridibundus]|uniref:leucine-rich repeat-containing protein 71 isoform X2 n=1 Tax=Chroicocephalus ridibundus TaxID=1192867 RepID=UPI002FDCB32F
MRCPGDRGARPPPTPAGGHEASGGAGEGGGGGGGEERGEEGRAGRRGVPVHRPPGAGFPRALRPRRHRRRPQSHPPAGPELPCGWTQPGPRPAEEPAEPPLPEVLAAIERKFGSFQPRIQVERDHGDPQSVRAVFLRGWKMEEDRLGVLSRCLPTLAGLRALHLWKVGLTEQLLPALAALLARCPRLRTLSLEGSPLPELAFPTLMGSDSAGVGDAGARRVGQSLAALGSSNRGLVSLVLSFNRISDLGAGYIAQGLRLNRSLLSLSLANNDIGDTGATRLAEVLGPFALTHAEVVERRRLLLAEALGRTLTIPKDSEGQSEQRSSLAPDKLLPAKYGKTPAKKKESLRKEETRQPKKPPEPRAARGRDAKASGQEKPSPEAADPAHPLLEEARQEQGSVILPGNRALLNLNLTHNRITQRGLGAFLAALEGQQREKKPKVPGQQGLLCLSLQKNRIPAHSPALARLRELLPPQDAPPSAPCQEEQQDPGT